MTTNFWYNAVKVKYISGSIFIVCLFFYPLVFFEYMQDPRITNFLIGGLVISGSIGVLAFYIHLEARRALKEGIDTQGQSNTLWDGDLSGFQEIDLSTMRTQPMIAYIEKDGQWRWVFTGREDGDKFQFTKPERPDLEAVVDMAQALASRNLGPGEKEIQ